MYIRFFQVGSSRRKLWGNNSHEWIRLNTLEQCTYSKYIMQSDHVHIYMQQLNLLLRGLFAWVYIKTNFEKLNQRKTYLSYLYIIYICISTWNSSPAAPYGTLNLCSLFENESSDKMSHSQSQWDLEMIAIHMRLSMQTSRDPFLGLQRSHLWKRGRLVFKWEARRWPGGSRELKSYS